MPTIEDARRWYPQDDPVHGFDHILRVLHLAERLAQAEGADLEIVRAAALLHDAAEQGDSTNDPFRTGAQHRLAHQHTSAEIAAAVLSAEGWTQERIGAVQHAIRAHRFRDDREPPNSVEARVLFDADKLDAIGAIGAARAVAYAARQGMPADAPPSARFLKPGEPEPGELHSAFHEFCFKLRRIRERMHTPSGRQIAEERHRRMSVFFKQLEEEASTE
jgi:uncharacterized protein